jgi:hypothetical protein
MRGIGFGIGLMGPTPAHGPLAAADTPHSHDSTAGSP